MELNSGAVAISIFDSSTLSIMYDRTCPHKPEISIITPTFNVVEYIYGYLSRIKAINQVIPVETIVVDKGSTDRTIEHLRRVMRDLEVCGKVLIMDLNVSSARNIGLNLSTGEYVYFLDADDIPVINAFGKVEDIIINYRGSQVIVGNYMVYDAEANKVSFNHMFKTLSVLNCSELLLLWLSSVCDDDVDLRLQNMIFEREFLIRNSIKFHPDAISHEDFEFIINALSKCRQAVVVPEYVAIYRYIGSRTINHQRFINGLKVLRRSLAKAENIVRNEALEDLLLLQDISSLLGYYVRYMKTTAPFKFDKLLIRFIENKYDRLFQIYVSYVKQLVNYCKTPSLKWVRKLLLVPFLNLLAYRGFRDHSKDLLKLLQI